MPGIIAAAAPATVMPNSLSTAFSESRSYAQLQCAYHDYTMERYKLAETSRKSFTLSKLLTSSQTATLWAFWQARAGGLSPFYFYNVVEGPYDPTGVATTGRYTVRFEGNWEQATGMPRTQISRIELVEVA